MGDYWVDMALAVLFSILKQVIKNPTKKAEMKKAFLKLRDNINLAYAGDADFGRMINSRRLEDLDPYARNICNLHLANCSEAGIELIVTSTYRDYEAQDALYAIGRTVHQDRRYVTNAKAGHSWHNFKCAWDVVPVVSGKPVWDERDPLWHEVIKLGKEAGAEAGADWPTFKDMPHFQVRPLHAGLHITLEEAMLRWKDSGTIFTA